jgi:hypothetical protein
MKGNIIPELIINQIYRKKNNYINYNPIWLVVKSHINHQTVKQQQQQRQQQQHMFDG